jgi:hypothetical protein
MRELIGKKAEQCGKNINIQQKKYKNPAKGFAY